MISTHIDGNRVILGQQDRSDFRMAFDFAGIRGAPCQFLGNGVHGAGRNYF